MAFLLDTVTLSELRKKTKADPGVLAWQSAHPGKHNVSVITLNEIRFGIRRVHRRDEAFAERLRHWYREILHAADLLSILPVDLKVAEIAADLRYDHQMGYDDSLIAATAQALDLTLVTRDVDDFESVGISLVNPWEVEAG